MKRKNNLMSDKDWTGNNVAYSKTAWFTSHSLWERQQQDYYATEPKAIRLLMELEDFDENIRECACGEWHLSKEMEELWKSVFSSDLIDRWYGIQHDFLNDNLSLPREWDIITNPPYKYANQFIEKWMKILQDGKKMALFLPIRYLEWKERKMLFAKYPPLKIYVSSSRIKCAINWQFDKMTESAVCYAWFVRQKWYTWDTILKWFN